MATRHALSIAHNSNTAARLTIPNYVNTIEYHAIELEYNDNVAIQFNYLIGPYSPGPYSATFGQCGGT